VFSSEVFSSGEGTQVATRDVFSEDELAQLRGFPDPARAELIRYFTLAPADEAFVRKYRGQPAFSGYLNRPGAIAATFTGGWYRTGDLARFDADGDFWLTGRADDMIISGASNIYPKEVEAVLGTYPGIVEVAVAGVPDDRYGELVVACAAGNGLSAAGMDAHCRASDLADYKRPLAYLFRPELPPNNMAKVLRSDLRRAAAEAHRGGCLDYIDPPRRRREGDVAARDHDGQKLKAGDGNQTRMTCHHDRATCQVR
jgi:acyl-CoA synthetase (AMP-forming)/AMP-acid ligase II